MKKCIAIILFLSYAGILASATAVAYDLMKLAIVMLSTIVIVVMVMTQRMYLNYEKYLNKNNKTEQEELKELLDMTYRNTEILKKACKKNKNDTFFYSFDYNHKKQ